MKKEHNVYPERKFSKSHCNDMVIITHIIVFGMMFYVDRDSAAKVKLSFNFTTTHYDWHVLAILETVSQTEPFRTIIAIVMPALHLSFASSSYPIIQWCYSYGPPARCVKLRVAHAPGMPQVSNPDMHHCTCVTHVPWCMPGLLTSGLLWSRWRGKCSQRSRRMRNPQFYIPGKRPIEVSRSHGIELTPVY